VIQIKRTLPLVILSLDELSNSMQRGRVACQVLSLFLKQKPSDGDVARIQRAVKRIPATLWILNVYIYCGVLEECLDEGDRVLGGRRRCAQQNGESDMVAAVDFVAPEARLSMARISRTRPEPRDLA
jgi:hypothetical protein